MTTLIVVAVVLISVALMAFLVERFAKPIDEKKQAKYNKILPVLVFLMLMIALIKEGLGYYNF